MRSLLSKRRFPLSSVPQTLHTSAGPASPPWIGTLGFARRSLPCSTPPRHTGGSAGGPTDVEAARNVGRLRTAESG